MKKTFRRCMITVAAASGLYAAAVFAAVYIASNVIWQPSSIYYFLSFLYDYSIIIVPVVWLVMVLIIIYIYWEKTVVYIEDIAEASEALVRPDGEDVRLPAELHDIESRMNHIKRAAFKSAYEAREAEQRKNDLVVNLAHDIRTPLASVIGYLSLLDEAPDMPAEQRAKYTGITLDKAYRLERLIEEFFEITRFNLSSIVLNCGKINLSVMLRQMADEFYPMLDPQGKRAAVEAPDELTLWGDADKLSRVFNNILKNAIAYSCDDSTITIGAFVQGENTVIEFTNTGDPIPPQQLETIFERFFRLDTARSSQTGGSGLGLAIAKEIVDAHGGTISARSDEARTTFTVVLPTRDTKSGKKTPQF